MHIWIDTDIGDDIDDILTISWAVKNNTEIVGISTVYRQARERLAIVNELLKDEGKDEIKIYEGYSETVSEDALRVGKLNYASSFPVKGNDPENAVDALLHAVSKFDDLVVLAIGAQTNIAKACQKAPEIMKNAKIVIMGGAFFCHTAEWNIVCDPMAAKIVSLSGADITYIPWDITRYICIGKQNYDKILAINANSCGAKTAEFVKQWSKRNTYIPLLHDPAAYYFCKRPELFSIKEVKLKIVAEGEFMGLTLNLNDYTLRKDKTFFYPTVKVATDCERNVIISDFMKDVFDI